MDYNSIASRLSALANVNPADINMAAKNYYEPIVKPLTQEGGQRFADFFGSLGNTFASDPMSSGQVSPEFALRNALSKAGNLGGLYDANLGMRNFYDTSAKGLGDLGMQNLQFKQNSLKDLASLALQHQANADQAAYYASQNTPPATTPNTPNATQSQYGSNLSAADVAALPMESSPDAAGYMGRAGTPMDKAGRALGAIGVNSPMAYGFAGLSGGRAGFNTLLDQNRTPGLFQGRALYRSLAPQPVKAAYNKLTGLNDKILGFARGFYKG